jgi:hypothetical protein
MWQTKRQRDYRDEVFCFAKQVIGLAWSDNARNAGFDCHPFRRGSGEECGPLGEFWSNPLQDRPDIAWSLD